MDNKKSEDIPKLQIVIDTKQDVELLEFSSSMSSINEEYHRFLSQKYKEKRFRGSCKLYINKIVPGSIIIDLVEKAPEVLPYITPILVDYSTFLTLTFDYLCGKSNKLPEMYKYTRDVFAGIKRIVEPIANVKGNSLNVIGINFGKVTINNNYNHTDANAIQNQCTKEIKRLDQSGDSLIKEKVTLKLYQARNSVLSKSTKGNLGIIEEVFENPKPLSFSNDRVRYDVTKAEENPFNFNYIVDIEIKLKEGSMFLETHKDVKEYEILKLYGPIENQDLFLDTAKT